MFFLISNNFVYIVLKSFMIFQEIIAIIVFFIFLFPFYFHIKIFYLQIAYSKYYSTLLVKLFVAVYFSIEFSSDSATSSNDFAFPYWDLFRFFNYFEFKLPIFQWDLYSFPIAIYYLFVNQWDQIIEFIVYFLKILDFRLSINFTIIKLELFTPVLLCSLCWIIDFFISGGNSSVKFSYSGLFRYPFNSKNLSFCEYIWKSDHFLKKIVKFLDFWDFS